MTERIRWVYALTVLTLVAVVAPALAQDETPPAALADRSEVGGAWAVLDGPFDLAGLGPGPETRLVLERANLVVDRRGLVLAREMTSIVLRRVPLADRAATRYEFERFTVRRESGASSAQEREIPLPGGPNLVLDTATFDLSMIAEVAAPETNAAEFRVLAIDAVSWDLLLAELKRSAAVEIGQEVPIPRPAEPQPIPGGTYEMGAGSLRVAGLTRVGGEPCLEVRFAIEGSEVSIENASVKLDGHEYVRGTVAISLRDGRLVAGEIWGPVVATFRQPDGPELPIGGIVQYVTLRETPR